MPEILTEVKAAVEKLAKTFEEYKAANDNRIEELVKKGSVDPILDEKVKKLDEDVQTYSEVLEELGKQTQERIDQLETALNRSPVGSPEEAKEIRDGTAGMNAYATAYGREANITEEQYVDYCKAFDSYIRRDERVVTAEEYRALAIGSDPDGGFWVVPQVAAMIMTFIFETSPVRELASVMQIGSKSVTMVIDDDEAASGWLGETETPVETATPKIREKEIVAFTEYAEPRATMEMLDDANINVEQWLANKVSQKLSRQENTAFVLGNGVGRPRGFMDYADGTTFGKIQQVVSGSAADFTFDGLIDLQTALKEPYQANATWLLRRASIGNIRKLKDTTNQYLWQPNNQAGTPPLLLGRPVRMADDIAGVAADALAMVYGDLRAGYQIVDRLGIRVQRDALTTKPFIKFFTTKRVGGDVVNFEAFKIQKLST